MSSDPLGEADLLVDSVYGGSRAGNASDDPLPRLLGVDSGAGFRHLGKRPATETLKLLVLKTSFTDVDWPDSLDPESGVFTYYGDRRAPGDLHDTPRMGNAILRNLFESAHSTDPLSHFPAIFVFGNTGNYRDVRFLGLAVPGVAGMSADEDLVAVWRQTSRGTRFQNYKSHFTILDVGRIDRQWIYDIQRGCGASSDHAPPVWLEWLRNRRLSPLTAQPASRVRSKTQQLPDTDDDAGLVQLIYSEYKSRPTDFERCAAELARLALPGIREFELTRPWRDGGRDATGRYRIGEAAGYIDVQFALEAKCYQLGRGVGVSDLARLISRLRHRQFGILVTTSYLSDAAYKELIGDDHPVVVISARDIAALVKRKIGDGRRLRDWLDGIGP